MLKYKGYVGTAQFDDKASLFHGDIIGLRDVITFRAMSVEELHYEFEKSIDGYLEWCRELGEEPEKPCLQ